MLAARPPQVSRHLPPGWIIVPTAGLGDDVIAADGMVIVDDLGSPGRHLIRARKALADQGFLFLGCRGIDFDPEGT